MRSTTMGLAIALLASSVFAACAQSGHDGAGGSTISTGPAAADGSAPAPSGGTSPAPTVAVKLACTSPNPGSPLLRLLNRQELDQTLTDLFPQVQGQWTDTLPADGVSYYGFNNDHSASVGSQLAGALLDTALSVATALTAPATLPNVLPCST
ncbi:MAG TPA: DUF1587 domain-containing protein, partial [Polyangiaceae bacterium]|nr:DUF1587 domain-containing protein [Polyangiaceae bacterium]